MRVLFLLSLWCVLSACQPVDKTYAPKFDISEFKPAGEATLKRVNTRTFIHPSGNLSLDDELDFSML